MHIPTALIPDLRLHLQAIDACSAIRDDLAVRIARAEAAAGRLRQQLADLEREAAEVADIRIPATADRVAQLIDGGEVAQLDRREVEARALKGRLNSAQRRQITEDLGAVDAQLALWSGQKLHAEQKIAETEVAFLRDLSDGLVAAYKTEAAEFIARHIPQMCSVAHRLRIKSGAGPHWEGRVFGGLRILWHEDEPVRETPHHPEVWPEVRLWPRSDNTLISGEPVVHDAIVERLIEAIRATALPSDTADPA